MTHRDCEQLLLSVGFLHVGGRILILIVAAATCESGSEIQ